jgi:hypothetical protein
MKDNLVDLVRRGKVYNCDGLNCTIFSVQSGAINDNSVSRIFSN